MEKVEYAIQQDGWLDGIFRKRGDIVSLTPRAAEYLLGSGQIALKKQGQGSETAAVNPAGQDQPADDIDEGDKGGKSGKAKA